MCAHKYTPCEIPLTGKSHCLSDAASRHVLQRLYIEVIIVGFQALSSIFPLFCIIRTSDFLFLKCFPAGQPILSDLSLKRLHTCFILLHFVCFLQRDKDCMKGERGQALLIEND